MTGDHPDMSAAADSLTVRVFGPETVDETEVVAVDTAGNVVGRASLSRLYGLRAALTFDVAPDTTVALVLADALEREARLRGVRRLELDASAASGRVVCALRRWRDVRTEPRGDRIYLTWPTTPEASS